MHTSMEWVPSIAESAYRAFCDALAAPGEPPQAMFLAIAVKGTSMLVAAGVAAALTRSAALRHLAWSVALAFLLALPVLAVALPAFELPGLPAAVPEAAPTAGSVVASGAGGTPALPVGPAGSTMLAATSGGAPTLPAAGPQPWAAEAGRPPAAALSVSPGHLAAALWIAGLGLLLAAFAAGRQERRRLARHARPVTAGSWLELLGDLCAELRIRRPPRLLISERAAVPMTWGVARPVILLPASAAGWPARRRRDVLLHELAHVRRRDVLPQTLAQLACAVYWFHPLVWWAARRLRAESELACDDRVLAAGSRPSDYAGHLLAAARSLRGAVPRAAVAMARTPSLRGRIEAILDPRRDRTQPGARRLLTGGLLAVSLLLLAAAAPPAPEPPSAPRPPAAPEPPRAPQPAEAPEAPEAPETPEAPEPPERPSAYRGNVEIKKGTVAGYEERCGSGELSESIHGKNGDYDIEIEVGRCTFDIEMRGEIEFTPDETGVERMGRGAYLEIDERIGRDRRRVEISPGPGGRPEIAWLVDRREQPFDAEGRRWLREALPLIFRATGIDAPARVGRILERAGPAGVLAEVPLLLGDHVQRIYLRQLLDQASLDAGELERAIRLAGHEIDSDYELAELLTSLSDRELVADGPRRAYVEATGSIGSDFELRRALRSLLDRRLSAAVLDAVLDAAQTIDSDFEMAELLIELVSKGLPPRPGLFVALATVGSDYEHRRVLSAVVERAELSDELARAVLESSRSIGSDYEQAELLVRLARAMPVTDALRPSFLAALESVGSTHERGRVLATLD